MDFSLPSLVLALFFSPTLTHTLLTFTNLYIPFKFNLSIRVNFERGNDDDEEDNESGAMAIENKNKVFLCCYQDFIIPSVSSKTRLFNKLLRALTFTQKVVIGRYK